MKKIIIMLILLIIPQAFLFSDVSVTGQGNLDVFVQTVPSYITVRTPTAFAVGKSSYVNGGLVFDYSIEVPTSITTGIEFNGSQNPAALYSAVVSAQGFATATIKVFKVVAGVVSEAATGEVDVVIFAVAL